jgi:hypothetical protein
LEGLGPLKTNGKTGKIKGWFARWLKAVLTPSERTIFARLSGKIGVENAARTIQITQITRSAVE